MARLAHSQLSEGANRVAIAHGIFGRGRNWRTFGRQLTERLPAWSAILLDLREHGDSVAIETSPPHTVVAAADDVAETVGPLAPRALLGHSFGGNVMLATRARLDVALTWIVDSSPSASPAMMTADPAPAAVTALRWLESLPPRFASRQAFMDALTSRGVAAGVAQFLATNLARQGDAFALSIDLAAIRALLTDYFATDFWSEVERAEGGAIAVAIADRGSALSPADQERLEDLAARTSHITLHRFPDAGHWLHVDAFDALLAAVASSLDALDH